MENPRAKGKSKTQTIYNTLIVKFSTNPYSLIIHVTQTLFLPDDDLELLAGAGFCCILPGYRYSTILLWGYLQPACFL